MLFKARGRTQQTVIPDAKPLSLKRSVFLRMLLISFAAVLVFYAMGMTINIIGIHNVRNDMQTALQTHAEYVANQLDGEFDRLKFFVMETISDKQLLRFAISHDILSDWERLSYIRNLSRQEYMIKRSSTLVDSVQIMFPGLGKTIITEPSQYMDLNPEEWDQLMAQTERGKVAIAERDHRIWLLMPRFDVNKPLFMVAFSISSDALSAWMERLSNDQTYALLLNREDQSVLSEYIKKASDEEAKGGSAKDRLEAGAALISAPFAVKEYSYINRALEPFVLYRAVLWGLTLLALGLLTAYMLFYRRAILRPLNDLRDSMRNVERDRRYRIEASGNSDYDDIYAQFNHMVDHIEQLASQLYEEKYRVQKAELKQLQMQIDPHFLYNSLYMIYRIAQSEGNESIATLSLNLSNYYRYITKMPEQIVPLRNEIQHVRNYLEIQRIRFEPRIHVEMENLLEEIADEMIPSLIIQPIVENAFQHGVKDVEKDGLVRLHYEVETEHFSVIVSDNSGKMDDEKVRKLWEQVTDPDSPDSSALSNLYRRLTLYEGTGHELELKCVDGGLTAILRFRRRGTGDAHTADR